MSQEAALKVLTAVVTGALAKAFSELDEETKQRYIKQFCEGSATPDETAECKEWMEEVIVRELKNPEALKAFFNEHLGK